MSDSSDPSGGEGADDRPDAPQRRVVLHPRTASARRVDRVRASGTRVRGYSVDNPEVMAYVARQRRTALWVFVPVSIALTITLVVTMAFDAVGRWKLGDVPVLWLILGPAWLFGLLGAAVVSERRTLRLEDEWIAGHR
ncbi:MAG: hypothetical protein AAF567_09720 [Actinomycetota bacterium]